MNKHYFERFIKFSIYFIGLIFSLYTIRLYYLQILHGSELNLASNMNRVKVLSVPAPRGIIYDRNKIALVKNKSYFSVSLLPVSTNIDIKGLSELLSIDQTVLAAKIKNGLNFLNPIILKDGLFFEDIAKIEAKRSDFPGLIIETNITRDYIHDNLMAHVIGYLGKPIQSQLDDPLNDNNITKDTLIGKWGVERLYNSTLMGTAGKRIVEVDAFGKVLRVLKFELPIKGRDLILSIDINAQIAAENDFKGRSGALVAINPNNGEILSLVSLPSFRPADFTLGINPKIWSKLNSDKSFPLLNRALQSAFPPGSIFKTIDSIAGIEEGVINSSFSVFCNGERHLGNHSYGCWRKGGHGTVAFPRGLEESCDLFYYEVGNRLGIDRIEKYAKLFGLGEKTGLQLSGESAGIVPGKQWKRKALHDSWYLGETLITAIGQGYLTITPIQAANMAAMIASNGKSYPLTLLKGPENIKPKRDLSIHAETFRKVKEAMLEVVHSPRGTAHSIYTPDIAIAGKTGTAQVVKGRTDTNKQARETKDHAWFIAFAPAETPEIALSVFIEHGGHGGSAAAPIALDVIKAYLKPKADEKQEAAPKNASDLKDQQDNKEDEDDSD
ncbi:MAG: penicillin-binding protein 2 [Nitrospirae bacterium]|nr:penicillin-binding protein 2 [Nitrospirota bacterium]MBF0540442.1 penicillin-binding protein 2 [Nitrospirota bacterium]